MVDHAVDHVVYLDCDVDSLVFVWVHSKMHSGSKTAFVVGGSNAERQLVFLRMWLSEISPRYRELCVIRGQSGSAPFGIEFVSEAPDLPPDTSAIERVMTRPKNVFFLRRPDPIEVPNNDYAQTMCYAVDAAPIRAANYFRSEMDVAVPAPPVTSRATEMLRNFMSADQKISLRYVALLVPETTNPFVITAVFRETIGFGEDARSPD